MIDLGDILYGNNLFAVSKKAHLSNKPVVMLYDKKVLCFHELNEAV